MKPSPYMDYMQNHTLIYDIQKFVYWNTSSVMREDENPLSPNTIGNTIIYYKTIILLDQQVATLSPKLVNFTMPIISLKPLFIFFIKNIFKLVNNINPYFALSTNIPTENPTTDIEKYKGSRANQRIVMIDTDHWSRLFIIDTRILVGRILELNHFSLRVLKFPLKCKTAAVSATLHPFSDLEILKRAPKCMRGARQYQKGEDRPVTLLQPLYYSASGIGVRGRSIGHGNDDATEFQCQDDHNVNTVCVGLSSLCSVHSM
ncbi:hypothetical protein QTP88_018079 [Uroleucon formosanum]